MSKDGIARAAQALAPRVAQAFFKNRQNTFLKIERYFARHEFKVDYVLCGSDCESLAIEDLLAFEPDAVDRFHRQWLGYTEPQGSPSLRREICKI